MERPVAKRKPNPRERAWVTRARGSGRIDGQQSPSVHRMAEMNDEQSTLLVMTGATKQDSQWQSLARGWNPELRCGICPKGREGQTLERAGYSSRSSRSSR
jgi:hypothetical protein